MTGDLPSDGPSAVRGDVGRRARSLPDLRVPRTTFLLVWAAHVPLLVGLLVTFDADPSGLVPPLAAVVLSLLSAWGIARCFVSLRRPTVQRGILISIVIWTVLAAVVRALTLAAVPDGFALGQVERWFLVMPLGALVVAVGASLGLHRWITIFAALSFVGVLTRDVGVRYPERTVSAAGVAQLERAAKSGHAVLMRGVSFSTLPDLSVPDGPAISRVAAAAVCRHVAGRWRHGTALGFTGRTLTARADVCWDRAGKPVSATLDAQWRAGREISGPYPVRLPTVDPFDVGKDATLSGGAAIGFEDRGVRAAADETKDAKGTEIFSRTGRFAESSQGDSFDPSTVTMRVGPQGDVAFAFALEAVDPLVRRSDRADEDGDVPGASLSALRTGRGRVVDILSMRVAPDADRNTARLMRASARGMKGSAPLSGDPG